MATQWQTGISYSIGDRVTYEGSTYECIQTHTSQSAWAPDATPALWELQEDTNNDSWQSGVAYKTDDKVMYNGVEYSCIQPHRAQDDWTPDATPALWEKGDRRKFVTESDDIVRKTYSQGITIDLTKYQTEFDEIKERVDNTPQEKTEPDQETLQYYNDNIAKEITDEKERLKNNIDVLQELKDNGNLPGKWDSLLSDMKTYYNNLQWE